MARNQSLPFYLPGDEVTCHAKTAISGRRLVAIDGPRVDGNVQVSHAGAGVRAFGVSAYDAAAGAKLTVYRVSAIHAIESGAALTAGAALKSDAVGRVIPQAGAGVIVGYACDDAAANVTAPVDFRA